MFPEALNYCNHIEKRHSIAQATFSSGLKASLGWKNLRWESKALSSFCPSSWIGLRVAQLWETTVISCSDLYCPSGYSSIVPGHLRLVTHTYNTQFSEVTKPFVQWQYKTEKSLSTPQLSRDSSDTLLKPFNEVYSWIWKPRWNSSACAGLQTHGCDGYQEDTHPLLTKGRREQCREDFWGLG